MSFESIVEAERDSLFTGKCLELQYGLTSKGQRFATLITSGVWYAVRVYLEEDHSDLERGSLQFGVAGQFSIKTNHATLSGAREQVATYRRQLEEGDFDAFLGQGSVFTALSFCKIIKKTPSDCAANPDRYLRRGDIVQTNFALVENHEGIYIGNGKVTHVSGHGDGKSASVAREGRLLGDFVSKAGDAIRVVVLQVRFRTGEEIAQKAEDYRDQKFRDGEYNLIARNCQHFTSLCAIGRVWIWD